LRYQTLLDDVFEMLDVDRFNKVALEPRLA
jgi:hypothetical protein